MKTTPGFGEPAVLASPIVSETFARRRSPLLAALARLRAERGPSNHALLESGGSGEGETPCALSVLATRPLARLTLRAGRFTLTPLEEDLDECFAPLARRLDEIRGEEPPSGGFDADRLRASGVMDGFRAAVAFLGDRSPTPMAPGLVGVFSYELVDAFERLPQRRPDPEGDPDASFVLMGDVILHDRRSGRVFAITRGLPHEGVRRVRERHAEQVALLQETVSDPAGDPPPARIVGEDPTPDAFRKSVAVFREHIRAGDIFQGVLSRSIAVASQADPLHVYARLRAANPSPYMFFLELSEGALLGASPETFVRVVDGCVEIRPIAGTAPRGLLPDGSIDPERDGRLALALRLDRKEQAEHAMLLDLARNDVARVARPGSVRVTHAFTVERFSHVQHLVSRVRGELRADLDALHAYQASANMGTLTGAPKIRAMELIRRTEPTARGFYGGACGYLLQDGSLDTCIVIRSLRWKPGIFRLRAGAGIVFDSDEEREAAETRAKTAACLEALGAGEAA